MKHQARLPDRSSSVCLLVALYSARRIGSVSLSVVSFDISVLLMRPAVYPSLYLNCIYKWTSFPSVLFCLWSRPETCPLMLLLFCEMLWRCYLLSFRSVQSFIVSNYDLTDWTPLYTQRVTFLTSSVLASPKALLKKLRRKTIFSASHVLYSSLSSLGRSG